MTVIVADYSRTIKGERVYAVCSSLLDLQADTSLTHSPFVDTSSSRALRTIASRIPCSAVIALFTIRNS